MENLKIISVTSLSVLLLTAACQKDDEIASLKADFTATVVGEAPNSHIVLKTTQAVPQATYGTIGSDPVIFISTEQTPKPIGIDKIGDLEINLKVSNGTQQSQHTSMISISGVEAVNVLDHGVVANDAAVDNADSIANILANHDVIYFPAGVYYTNGLWNKMRSNQVIFGDGKGASIIKRKDTINELLIEQISWGGVSNSVHDVTFRDIGIHGIENHQWSLVRFRNSYNLTFERVSFKHAEGPEFHPDGHKMFLLRFDGFDENSNNAYTNYVLNCDFEYFSMDYGTG